MTKEGYISRLRPINARAAVQLALRLLSVSVSIRVSAIACGVLLFGTMAHAAVKADAGKADPNGRVKTIRFWSHGDITRIAVEVSTKFTFVSDRLFSPDRLFFDIRGASPEEGHRGIRSMPVDDALVHQIRIAETQPRVTRVVVDLARTVTVTTSQLANPNRLIIELHAVSKSDLPAASSSSEVSSNSKRQKLDALEREITGRDVPETETVSSVNHAARREATVPRKFEAPAHLVQPHVQAHVVDVVEPEVAAPPLLALGKPARIPFVPSAPIRDLPPPPQEVHNDPVPAVSTTRSLPPATFPSGEPTAARISPDGGSSLTRVLGLKLGRIVLDPGHGGSDVGTHGPSGYLEKDLVMDVSHRLAALIEDRLGSEVIFTRSDDSYVPLEERTHIANQHKADLFLSIHANSSPYRSATGVETYVLNFTPTRAANELASRENASSASSVHDLKDLVEKIAAADKADESREFAAKIQYSLAALPARARTDAARNRGIKRAPFVVLIGANMPSVLAEIGFLSNSDEEAMLRKPEYREKIAEALYKGIASYAETLSRFDVARKN